MKKESRKTVKVRKEKKSSETDYERGRIEKISLKKPFTFNGTQITEAIIEIDHINHGLNKKTLKLNGTKRSDFTIGDIERFLILLNEEYVSASSYRGKVSRYEVRINSPIKGSHLGKEYLLVFEIDYDTGHLIHTITLFPNW